MEVDVNKKAFLIWMPIDIARQISAMAKKERRSFTAQVIHLLTRALSVSSDA